MHNTARPCPPSPTKRLVGFVRVSKLKCDMCPDQEAEELEGIVRSGSCELGPVAFQGLHLVPTQQVTGQADHAPISCPERRKRM